MLEQPAQTLADFFGVEKVKFALVIIDVQHAFTNPSYIPKHSPAADGTEHTKAIATDIAKIEPQFHAAGVSVYVVHLKEFGHDFRLSGGGAYQVEIKDYQHKVLKTESSAITSSNLPDQLIKNGHSHLLIVGGNSSDCYFNTVKDALEQDFNVAVLGDLVYEDQGRHEFIDDNLSVLADLGAIRTTASKALELLQR